MREIVLPLWHRCRTSGASIRLRFAAHSGRGSRRAVHSHTGSPSRADVQASRVEANVHHRVVSAQRAMPDISGNDLLYWRSAVDLHIEIEGLFPHRREKDQMPLLAGIFLRDLQFDRFVGLASCPKQWRRRLAHLKINGPVFDLERRCLRIPVQRVKVIVGGSGAVVLGIAPVDMMVVNKTAIHYHSVMRLQGARNYVGRVGGGPAVLRGPERPSESALMTNPAKSGIADKSRSSLCFHHAATLGSSGSNVFSPPRSPGSPNQRRSQAVFPNAGTHRPRAPAEAENPGEQARVSVHIINGADIDADRGQQTPISATRERSART